MATRPGAMGWWRRGMIGFACGIALVVLLAGIVGHRVMTIVAEALDELAGWR